MTVKKILSLLGIVALASLILVACGNKQSDEKTLKVGVMTLDDVSKPIWDQVAKDAEKEGVKLEFVEFAKYSEPNDALDAGDIDVNAFQTYDFMNEWNDTHKTNIVSVGETLISPIRLFSKTEGDKAVYSDVKDLPDGAKIGFNNEASNQSRALFLLQSAGLIKLSTKDGDLATVKDVTDNPHNFDFVTVDGGQLPKTLRNGDVDAAVINNSYAQASKLDYKTTIYTEDVKGESSKKFINVISANADWKKSDKADAIKTLVKVYQTKKVGELISKSSNGVDVPIWKGAPDTSKNN